MFNKVNKRGQAAMEFLMTYGWAILAAVIVVGVLWYMIGNPANLAGDNFKMSTPVAAIAVEAEVVGSDGILNLEWRNGGGNTMSVSQVTVSDTNCAANSTARTVPAGQVEISKITCAGVVTSGDRIAGDVTITYTSSGSTLTQRAKGTVAGQIP